MRMIVKRTLRGAGFGGHDISEADDGSVALESIRADPPDLILSDWNMPNMSGLELLETLTSEGYKINFGFITTEATPQMRSKAAQAGAKFLIAKPFTVDAFSNALSPFIQD